MSNWREVLKKILVNIYIYINKSGDLFQLHCICLLERDKHMGICPLDSMSHGDQNLHKNLLLIHISICI